LPVENENGYSFRFPPDAPSAPEQGVFREMF